jgi:hypothetical protein
MIGFESFGWKISSTWNPDLVTFKIWDMDVVYINELLEKRRSHGMNYFGKDKKNLKVFFFFFFPEKNLRTKQTPENTEKCFPEIFFSKMQPNTVKYFMEIILLWTWLFFSSR